MGVNARNGDYRTAADRRVTESREAREAALREKVRNGLLSLDDFLTKFKGYKPEHAQRVRAQFQMAIFG